MIFVVFFFFNLEREKCMHFKPRYNSPFNLYAVFREVISCLPFVDISRYTALSSKNGID